MGATIENSVANEIAPVTAFINYVKAISQFNPSIKSDNEPTQSLPQKDLPAPSVNSDHLNQALAVGNLSAPDSVYPYDANEIKILKDCIQLQLNKRNTKWNNLFIKKDAATASVENFLFVFLFNVEIFVRNSRKKKAIKDLLQIKNRLAHGMIDILLQITKQHLSLLTVTTFEEKPSNFLEHPESLLQIFEDLQHIYQLDKVLIENLVIKYLSPIYHLCFISEENVENILCLKNLTQSLDTLKNSVNIIASNELLNKQIYFSKLYTQTPFDTCISLLCDYVHVNYEQYMKHGEKVFQGIIVKVKQLLHNRHHLAEVTVFLKRFHNKDFADEFFADEFFVDKIIKSIFNEKTNLLNFSGKKGALADSLNFLAYLSGEIIEILASLAQNKKENEEVVEKVLDVNYSSKTIEKEKRTDLNNLENEDEKKNNTIASEKVDCNNQLNIPSIKINAPINDASLLKENQIIKDKSKVEETEKNKTHLKEGKITHLNVSDTATKNIEENLASTSKPISLLRKNAITLTLFPDHSKNHNTLDEDPPPTFTHM